MLGHSWHGQQLVDAARREDQAVVAEPGLRPSASVTSSLLASSSTRSTEPRINRTPWSAGEGDRDTARVDDAGRHLGQERQVEEVVGRVDHHDLGPAAGEADESTGGVVAGEARPHHDDPRPTTSVDHRSNPHPGRRLTGLGSRPLRSTPRCRWGTARFRRAARRSAAGLGWPAPRRGSTRPTVATSPTPQRESVVGDLR